MKVRKKGQYGYIRWKKATQLIYTILMLILGVIVFVIGYFANNQNTANMFTVIAILFVLPGARYLTGYIVLFPYRTVSERRYKKLEECKPIEGELLMDMVFTSSKTVMNLDFLWFTNERAYGLVGKKKQDVDYIKEYLTSHANRYVEGYSVQIMEEEEGFFKQLKEVALPLEKTKDLQEMMEDVMSLIL